MIGRRSRGRIRRFKQLEERIDRCVSLKEAGREIGALEVRLERATSAAGRRKELDARIAALNAPDPGGVEVDSDCRAGNSTKPRCGSRLSNCGSRFVAECALAAEVLVGDPAGPTRLATGETAVTRGDGHLKIRLPGVATLDISGPSGDAAEWRAKRDESGARSVVCCNRSESQRGRNWWIARRSERRLAIELATAKAEYDAAIGTRWTGNTPGA